MRSSEGNHLLVSEGFSLNLLVYFYFLKKLFPCTTFKALPTYVHKTAYHKTNILGQLTIFL